MPIATSTSGGAVNGLEPRFSISPNTPRSSRISLVIGGVRIYIYGLEELPCSHHSSPVLSVEEKEEATNEVAVLHLAHNRTRTFKVTEDIAHEVLYQYRTDGRTKRMGMIAVTMNMRNHGDREIMPDSNRTWSDGNLNHGMDLLSLIDGSAQDFKLVLDYLPTYLPQFSRLHNIMAGVSLGGHTAWRMAALAAPGQISAYCMVVGCPNLTSLLLGRLGIEAASLGPDADPERLDLIDYDRLNEVMSDHQRRLWPRALAELVREGDRKVQEGFPTDVPLLLCNGLLDPLVPTHFTTAWVASRAEHGGAPSTKLPYEQTNGAVGEIGKKQKLVEVFVQDNTGHSCTKEMVALIANWLGNMFESN